MYEVVSVRGLQIKNETTVFSGRSILATFQRKSTCKERLNLEFETDSEIKFIPVMRKSLCSIVKEERELETVLSGSTTTRVVLLIEVKQQR